MFLFILESIGTSELILIGIVALIFLGPRKLPQIARTIGRTMADFRSTTNEFKETWQREVDFESEINAIRTGDILEPEVTPVPRIEVAGETTNSMTPPDIKPIQTDLFAEAQSQRNPTPETSDEKAQDEDDLSDKRNWL